MMLEIIESGEFEIGDEGSPLTLTLSPSGGEGL